MDYVNFGSNFTNSNGGNSIITNPFGNQMVAKWNSKN